MRLASARLSAARLRSAPLGSARLRSAPLSLEPRPGSAGGEALVGAAGGADVEQGLAARRRSCPEAFLASPEPGERATSRVWRARGWAVSAGLDLAPAGLGSPPHPGGSRWAPGACAGGGEQRVNVGWTPRGCRDPQ
ncbi:hypothetical protein Nmel_018255 [Mimus melanotis]